MIEGTSLERRENGLAVMLRYAPLALAAVVVEGNLRSRLAPARKGLVEEPDGRAVFVCGQDLQAPQGVSAPRPIPQRLKTSGELVIRITPSARFPRLKRRGGLVVDVLAALDARPDRVRQNLPEALHFGRGIGE